MALYLNTFRFQAIVEEVLKTETVEEKEKYENILTNTISKLKSSKKTTPTGYRCTLVGCQFNCKRHRQYIIHLKTAHWDLNNYICHFGLQCRRIFPSIESLGQHVDEEHVQNVERPSVSLADEECLCPKVSCGNRKFRSIKELISHYNTKHLNESRICIFSCCNTRFQPGQVARYHYNRKHGPEQQHSLREEFKPKISPVSKINVEVEIPLLTEENIQHGYFEGFAEDFAEDDEVSPEDNDPEREKHYFMMAFADFMNRMSSFWFHPLKHVKEIALKYLSIFQESSESKRRALERSLNMCEKLTAQDREKILKSVQENDHFLIAQEELISEHKRTKFLAENFKLVKPIEIILNPEEVLSGFKKDSYHYVPIKESLKNLLEDESYTSILEKGRNNERYPNIITDITDGQSLSKNSYMMENPDAVPLLLYSDAVELVNPLGIYHLCDWC